MIEKRAAKVGARLRPAHAIAVSFNAGAAGLGGVITGALLAGEAAVVDGRFVVSGGVLSGFVLVVLMEVLPLIEVRVGDRGGGRWLRHREGGTGETPDGGPVAMPVGRPFGAFAR